LTSLVCPVCNHRGTTVLDSRPLRGMGLELPHETYRGCGPRRRHQCNDCGFRWSTHEIALHSLRELTSGQPHWPEAIALHLGDSDD
jgi:transcriptional regulator NrdR family protein